MKGKKRKNPPLSLSLLGGGEEPAGLEFNQIGAEMTGANMDTLLSVSQSVPLSSSPLLGNGLCLNEALGSE